MTKRQLHTKAWYKLLMLWLVISLVLLPTTAVAQVTTGAPVPTMMAIAFVDDQGTGAANAAEYVKMRVAEYAADTLPATLQFPLVNTSTDSVRALKGFHPSVVIRWLDPLTWDNGVDAPRFGANNDYIAYFGEGWQESGSLSPIFRGSDTEGWVWSNHEYISNDMPTLTSAPTGQQLTLAKFLQAQGVLTNDVTSDTWSQADLDTHIRFAKRQLGGSWLRIVQDPATGAWSVDRSANNLRYDATSNTLISVVGTELSAPAIHDTTGEVLTATVVSGIMGDCSGGQTPWGTIMTAEENVQDYYGDLEACWSSNNAFVPGAGFDPGAAIAPILTTAESSAFGSISDPNGRHNRDNYGYLTEIHVGMAPSEYYESVAAGGDGNGHRKVGAFGRARWENAAIVVNENWELIDGQPVVFYAGDDRRSGRIYKFVSSAPYQAGMSMGEVRALLDEGTTYAGHFAGLDFDTGFTVNGEMPTEATPVEGQWIELSLASQDIAPNAAALGNPAMTVGEALQDVNWNGIGGFTSDNQVRQALFTVANKIGIAELNRPEDLEWNPKDPSGTPRVYIAFTNHTGQVALNQDGVLIDPAKHKDESPKRNDRTGGIFAVVEADPANPGASKTFQYFNVWKGSEGKGAFDAAAPDNLLIDRDGGVWFGTDGNYGRNKAADALYYLDLDPAHKEGQAGIVKPTYGLNFRVIAVPSDAEATGPAFSANMGTIFVNVQHPGEDMYSTWPRDR